VNAPVIILCGGRATRLASLFPDTPKALVPVGGQPFLRHQLLWLSRAGVSHIHLAAGHLSARLVEWLDSAACRLRGDPILWKLEPPSTPAPLAISLSAEPIPLGTGGGVRFAADALARHRSFEYLLALNGDTWLPNFSVQTLEAHFAKASNPWTTIAVTLIADAARFGTVRREGTRVVAFEEKGRAGSGWINAGVYALTRAAVSSISSDRPSSLEHDWFPRWAADGRLDSVPAPPPLYDIGTPDGLAELDRALQCRPNPPAS